MLTDVCELADWGGGGREQATQLPLSSVEPTAGPGSFRLSAVVSSPPAALARPCWVTKAGPGRHPAHLVACKEEGDIKPHQLLATGCHQHVIMGAWRCGRHALATRWKQRCLPDIAGPAYYWTSGSPPPAPAPTGLQHVVQGPLKRLVRCWGLVYRHQELPPGCARRGPRRWAASHRDGGEVAIRAQARGGMPPPPQ